VPGANRLPSGIEYDPSALTLMRLILPRRSFVFCAVRRASTNGAWNRSPSEVAAVVAATAAPVPVRPAADAAICDTFCCA
jgi:hypothetical protein